MREVPRIRGGAATRSALFLAGLGVFALGIVLMLESKLGLSPWDVLNQGIAERTPLSFGTSNIAVALALLVLVRRLGARVRAGTLANAVLIGLFVDLLLRIDVLRDLDGGSLGLRIALLLGGIVAIGGGSAFYIGAALGAGPRDSLMLALARRARRRLGGVRTALEASALLAGYALGGTVGLGTIAFALAIGPTLELACWVLTHSPLTEKPA